MRTYYDAPNTAAVPVRTFVCRERARVRTVYTRMDSTTKLQRRIMYFCALYTGAIQTLISVRGTRTRVSEFRSFFLGRLRLLLCMRTPYTGSAKLHITPRSVLPIAYDVRVYLCTYVRVRARVYVRVVLGVSGWFSTGFSQYSTRRERYITHEDMTGNEALSEHTTAMQRGSENPSPRRRPHPRVAPHSARYRQCKKPLCIVHNVRNTTCECVCVFICVRMGVYAYVRHSGHDSRVRALYDEDIVLYVYSNI